MRFIENGPSIPDELLTARDEGRVIFFCGSGVSRAKAGLPDFFSLASNVIERLGVSQESPSRKLLYEARELTNRVGVDGIISADRIFGLLEREFEPNDINKAVAECLKPDGNVDLSAHRTILELSTVNKKTRLVTTNFDRLFESCGSNVRYASLHRSIDLVKQSDFEGIIYLHGRINDSYTGAGGEGFVLSSSGFGRAYLSEAWATHFFKEIIKRYIVVFIGYSADDPPVNYLLEALNGGADMLGSMYAFQSGRSDEAIGRWVHKGVHAIPYNDEGGHQALWDTLDLWAKRSQNIDEWYKEKFSMAKKGPAALRPFERGQIAHIVSTIEGARKLSKESELSSEWLCVFDPYLRYGKTSSIGGDGIDVFHSYSLDSDSIPTDTYSDPYSKREVPKDAWDLFRISLVDEKNFNFNNYSPLRGHFANSPSSLPSRLLSVAQWLGSIANQPRMVWWASRQLTLHPEVKMEIEKRVRAFDKLPKSIRLAWKYIFDSMEANNRDETLQLYGISSEVDREGWDNYSVRKFTHLLRPHIKIEHRDRFIHENSMDSLSLRDLINIRLEYPRIEERLKVPDDFLYEFTRGVRRNLELALCMEMEINEDEPQYIGSLISEYSSDELQNFGNGVFQHISLYKRLFNRLLEVDISLAKSEFDAWKLDNSIFSKLKFWAAQNHKLVSASVLFKVFTEVSDEFLWESYAKKDVLTVLSSRWSEFKKIERKKVETRLLKGPQGEAYRTNKDGRRWRAYDILNVIQWLSSRGCNFTFDLSQKTDRLRKHVPEWTPNDAQVAIRSFDGATGGFVQVDENPEILYGIPISDIIKTSSEMRSNRETLLLRKDPFSGLCQYRPLRAYLALINVGKKGEFPIDEWNTFLRFDLEDGKKLRMAMAMTQRVSLFPKNVIRELIHALTSWLRNVSTNLLVKSPTTYQKMVHTLIDALRDEPEGGRSSVISSNRGSDHGIKAINSPVGKIAETLFKWPELKVHKKQGSGLPQDWMKYALELLHLGKDSRIYALNILSRNLNFLYYIDADWTERHLLAVLGGSNEDERNSFWDGFFRSAIIPHRELFLRMKLDITEFASNSRDLEDGLDRVVVGITLGGWHKKDTGDRWIKDQEMREILIHSDENFREGTIWQARVWMTERPHEWKEETIELFKNVWPKQKSIKSPKLSARLVDLVFADPDFFDELSDVIIPFLTKIDLDPYVISSLIRTEKRDDSIGDIINRYPYRVLDLLWAILPVNTNFWPYGISDIFRQLSEASPSLNDDKRFLELRRRWDSR